MTLVGIVSLGVNRPGHYLFAGSRIHQFLLAHCDGDPIQFVAILRQRGEHSLEAFFQRKCRQQNSIHPAVVVENRFLHLELSGLILGVITRGSASILHQSAFEIAMCPFSCVASLEIHGDRRHSSWLKYVYIGGHNVVLGVIGLLGTLEQVSSVNFHRGEFISPRANQKRLFARKRVNHLPCILVRLEERSVNARITEPDCCRG